jgi:hypothetical protein
MLAGIAFLIGGAVVTFAVCLVGATLILGLPPHYLNQDLQTFLATVPFTALVLSGSVTLLIPAALVLAGGIALLRGRRPQHMGFLAIGSVFTFVALLATAILGTQTGMAWEAHILNDPGRQLGTLILAPEELETIRIFGDEITWRVVEGSTAQVTVSGRQKELDRLSYSERGAVLNLELRPRASNCIFCDRSVVRVTITTPDPEALEVQRSRGPQVALPEGIGQGG